MLMDTGKNNYNAVLIDDNPLATRVLCKLLHRLGKREGIALSIREAQSMDTALPIMEHTFRFHRVNYIFLNLQLPSPSGTMIEGEMLARDLHRQFPDARMVIATSYGSPYHLHALLDLLPPEGLIVKGDLSYARAPLVLRSLILNPPYFSPTVVRLMEERGTSRPPVDRWDRQLLHELSQGATLAELESILPLARSTIGKRKRQLKDFFNIPGESDRKLVITAKEHGLI